MTEMEQKNTVAETLEAEGKTETRNTQEAPVSLLGLLQGKDSGTLTAALAGQAREQMPTVGAALGGLIIDGAGAQDGKKVEVNSVLSDKQALTKEKFEKKEFSDKEVPLAKELPLTRTESLMLKGLTEAINSRNINDVQEMLRTLNENPKSADRVLKAFARELESQNFLNRVSWEQGKDNRGESFIRLRLSQNNDASKSSGRTELSIGSDGRVSADHTDSFLDSPQPVNPEGALRSILHTHKLWLEQWQPKPKPLSESDYSERGRYSPQEPGLKFKK